MKLDHCVNPMQDRPSLWLVGFRADEIMVESLSLICVMHQAPFK
jgi:hypothetical protein